NQWQYQSVYSAWRVPNHLDGNKSPETRWLAAPRRRHHPDSACVKNAGGRGERQRRGAGACDELAQVASVLTSTGDPALGGDCREDYARRVTSIRDARRTHVNVMSPMLRLAQLLGFGLLGPHTF